MAKFNLLFEPWLSVSTEAGAATLSVRDALIGAATINRLAGRSPAIDAAVFLHVILGAYLDMAGVPSSTQEWRQRWDRGCFGPEQVDTWCAGVEDRFDLFDPVAPFAQVAGLEAGNGETKAIASIDPFRDLGGSTPLFWSPATEDDSGYTCAEAAALLIHVLAFDTAGIKTGAAGDPNVKGGKLYGNPVGPRGQVGTVIPTGANLFQTILLNAPVLPDGLAPDDLPHWRRQPATAEWSLRSPTGPLDWLTWLGRRVRLVANAAGNDRVYEIVMTGGDRFPSPSPDWEFHSAWRTVKNPQADEPPRRPLRHRSGRSAWQGMESLVALSRPANDSKATDPPRILAGIDALVTDGALDETYRLGAQTIGYEYGTQSAVVENLIIDEIPFPLAAARADSRTAELVNDIAVSAANLATALNRLDGDLRSAAGGDPTPWDKGQLPGTLLAQVLDLAVRRILTGLQTQPDRVDEAGQAWQTLAYRATRDLGHELLRTIPPEAFAGREISGGNKKRMVRADTADIDFAWRIKQALAVFDDYADDLDSEEQ